MCKNVSYLLGNQKSSNYNALCFQKKSVEILFSLCAKKRHQTIMRFSLKKSLVFKSLLFLEFNEKSSNYNSLFFQRKKYLNNFLFNFKNHQTIMRSFSEEKIHVSKTLQVFSTSKVSSNYNALFFQGKNSCV